MPPAPAPAATPPVLPPQNPMASAMQPAQTPEGQHIQQFTKQRLALRQPPQPVQQSSPQPGAPQQPHQGGLPQQQPPQQSQSMAMQQSQLPQQYQPSIQSGQKTNTSPISSSTMNGNMVKQLRNQGMDDPTIMSAAMKMDPTFAQNVTKMLPFVKQQARDWQQTEWPKFALNRQYGINTPAPKSDFLSEMTSHLHDPPPTTPTGAEPVEQPSVGGFFRNIFTSGENLIGNTVHAIIHPKETIKTLVDGSIGGVINAVNAVTGQHFQGTPEEMNTAGNIGHFFLNRYGSIDNIKKTAYEDPIGFLTDVGTAITLGGSAVGALGKLGEIGAEIGTKGAMLSEEGAAAAGEGAATSMGKTFSHPPEGMNAVDLNSPAAKMGRASGMAQKVGSTVSQVGNAMNPIMLAGKLTGLAAKGTGEFIKGSLGATTGAGKGAINEALGGSSQFFQGMRGDESSQLRQAVQDAKTGIDQLQEERTNNYLASKSSVGQSTAKLDPSIMKQAVDDNLKRFGIAKNEKGALDFNNSDIADLTSNKEQITRIKDAVQFVENKIVNPSNNTPLGWDQIKKGLDSLVRKDGSQADAFITSMKNTVKNATVQQVPEYGKMLEDYHTASASIQELERALSVGNKASITSAVRKLSGIMRTGNQGNNFTNSLLQELEQKTGMNIRARIGGTAMSAATPRGLSSTIGEAGILGVAGHVISPAFISALPFTSPRLMGEVLGHIGLAKNMISPVINSLLQKAGFPTLTAAETRLAESASESQSNTFNPGASTLHDYIKQNGFRLTQDFHSMYDAQKGYTKGEHGAYDLAPPTPGTTPPVPAFHEGTVVQTGTSGAYGNYIKIADQNGVVWLYGHLSNINVHQGNKVSRGQQVGIMGNTGTSEGVHLHLQAFRHDKPYDFAV